MMNITDYHTNRTFIQQVCATRLYSFFGGGDIILNEFNGTEFASYGSCFAHQTAPSDYKWQYFYVFLYFFSIIANEKE